MRAPEFDVVGWLKDLSPIVLALAFDIDLAYLCILGLAGNPDNEEDYFSCPFEYFPYVLGFEGLDGVLYTEEVSEEEYARILSGQGSTPKRDIAWSLTAMAAELDRIWGERLGYDPEDHIIRSEN